MKTLHAYTIFFLTLLFPHASGWAQGCSFDVSVIPTHVKCYGKTTGSARVMESPAGSYTYLWSTGDTTNELQNLGAGTYFVKVSDVTGCEIINFITITQPPKIEIEATQKHPVCYNENSGEIILNTTGGVEPHIFAWSNNVETASNLNLFSGTYIFTITDSNSCVETNTYTLVQPAIISTLAEVKTVRGYGLSDGSINISTTGGIHPYSYRWTSTAGYSASTEDIYNIPSSTYDLTITDSKLCVYDSSIFVSEPEPLALTAKITEVFCNAFSDGAIDVTVTGGVPPYSYFWENTEIVLTEETPTISELPMGSYYLTITDNNGISLSDSFYVDEPNSIVASIDVIDAYCYDSLNGSAFLTVSGGSTPFSFLWSSGANTKNIENVHAGEYEVEVVDLNGCFLRVSTTIYQPDSIMINTSVKNISCKDHYDGEISTDVKGGIAPYQYLWSNNDTRDYIDLLGVGVYSITVTDDHQCPITTSAEVTKPMFGCIEIPNAFTPNSDNINDSWIIQNSYLYPDIEVIVMNKEGYIVIQDLGYMEAWNGTFNGNDVASGTYYYVIDLHNGDPAYKGIVTILR
jgi:gliding motility-associated-like protein